MAANRLQIEDLICLDHYLTECERDDAVHVLVLTAEGSVFSSGLDLRSLGRSLDSTGVPGERRFEQLAERLAGFGKIAIAAINGPVIGGATDLALSCDFRVGVEDCFMRMPAARLGLPLYAGALRRYVSRLGLNNAKRLIFLAENVDAFAMREIGFLNEVVPREALIGRALSIARAIAAMPLRPLKAMKLGLDSASLGLHNSEDIDIALAAAFDRAEILRRIDLHRGTRPAVNSDGGAPE